MASLGLRLKALVDGPPLIPVIIVLVGIRFAAPSLTAFAGIEGVDPRGLDTAIEVYSDVLLVVLFLLLAVLVQPVSKRVWRDPGFLLFGSLLAAATIQWVGMVLPGARLVSGSLGPWADWLLAITATADLAVLTVILGGHLTRPAVAPARRDAVRALGFGFSAAYLLRSTRLLDFAYLFGWTLPSGVVWVLDFGPALLLALLAVVAWIRTARSANGAGAAWIGHQALPILAALLALGAAVGALGGFIIANALAWGGSYIVFSPTTVSLPIIGFGIGAFLSTAWTFRSMLPRDAWRLAFGGAAIAALAGIQTSAGTLPSVVGVMTGVACAARGVSTLARGPEGGVQ